MKGGNREHSKMVICQTFYPNPPAPKLSHWDSINSLIGEQRETAESPGTQGQVQYQLEEINFNYFWIIF